MKTTTEVLKAADELAVMAQRVQEIAERFDVGARECPCCTTVRYRNFPQKNVRDRVIGVAERLTELAGTLRRRSNDRDFLNGIYPPGWPP